MSVCLNSRRTFKLFNMNDLIVAEIKISYTHKAKNVDRPKIKCSKDAYMHIRQFFNPSLLNIKEEAVVLYLNQSNRVIGGFKVSSGGISSTVVDIALILGVAVKCLARALVLAHTHPSGELQPSKADLNPLTILRVSRSRKLAAINSKGSFKSENRATFRRPRAISLIACSALVRWYTRCIDGSVGGRHALALPIFPRYPAATHAARLD